MFGGCFSYFFGGNNKKGGRKYWTSSNLRSTLVKTKKSKIESEYALYPDQQLGKGGCGICIVGEGKKNHQKYAIKIVEKKDIERVRFDRELKLLKEVDHTNIVRLFTVFDSSAKFYFVMELCTGGHLGHYVTKQHAGFIEERTAKRLFLQLMSAIVHMHSRGIAHRDIKLQNILLDQDRNANTIQLKVIDFGFGSKFIGALPMKSNVGTLYTTAPEVMKECYDERCDVWSAGVVLFIMLCGKRPFEKYDSNWEAIGTKSEIADNIVSCRYQFNHPTWKKISRAGVGLVKSLLTPDYQARPHSSTVLENSWFDNAPQERVSPAISLKAVENMKRLLYEENTELAQTGMMVAAFSLNSTSSGDLRVVFQSFDTDSSGALSKAEFRSAIRQLAPDLSKADIETLFDYVDIDKNGSITYTEFLAACLDPREVDVGDLTHAFNVLDDDGNGCISKEEMFQVIKNSMEQAQQNSLHGSNLDGATSSLLNKQPSNVQRSALLQKSESRFGSRRSFGDTPINTKRASSGITSPNSTVRKGLSNNRMSSSSVLMPLSKDDMEKMIMDKVNRIFEQVDKNHDGVISESEFLWAMTGMDYHLKGGSEKFNRAQGRDRSRDSTGSKGNSPKRSAGSSRGSAGSSRSSGAKSRLSSGAIGSGGGGISSNIRASPSMRGPFDADLAVDVPRPLVVKQKNDDGGGGGGGNVKSESKLFTSTSSINRQAASRHVPRSSSSNAKVFVEDIQ